MSGPDPPPRRSAVAGAGSPAGLCDTCVHQRLVPNTRGSVFSLCERSHSEPEFPRYPRLPVLTCRGYDALPPDADARDRGSGGP